MQNAGSKLQLVPCRMYQGDTVQNYNSIIFVNIRRSLQERDSLVEATASAWKYKGKKQLKQLTDASVVVPVVNNQVCGVFENLETSIYPGDPDRVQFALAPCGALAAITGHSLPDSVRWKPGDGAAWKLLVGEEVQGFLEEARGHTRQFGPYSLKLTSEGNLRVIVPAGFNVEVISAATPASVKQRIERAIKALAGTDFVTTYGTLAEALGVNSSQAVARSIVSNTAITKEEAARVFNVKYVNSQGALVPDDDMSTHGGDIRTRPELLVESAGATWEDDKAKIPLASILLDPIVLRLTLNI